MIIFTAKRKKQKRVIIVFSLYCALKLNGSDFDMPLKVIHCFSLIHFYFSVNQGFKEIIDRPNISFRLCYPFNDHYLFNDDLKQKNRSLIPRRRILWRWKFWNQDKIGFRVNNGNLCFVWKLLKQPSRFWILNLLCHHMPLCQVRLFHSEI